MLNISLKGDDIIKEKIERARKRTKNYRKFFANVVKPDLQRQFDQVFERQGVPRWKQLRPATIAQKREDGITGRILERKGRLRRAYSTDSPDSTWTITDNKLKFLNRVPYAEFHEEGQGVPKREVVASVLRDKSVRRQLIKKLKDYILKP